MAPQHVGNHTAAGLVSRCPRGRSGWFTERVPDDVLAHLLLLARSQGVDVEAAVRRKWLAWEADLG